MATKTKEPQEDPAEAYPPEHRKDYRIVLGEALEEVQLPRELRRQDRIAPVRPLIQAAEVQEALLATQGSQEILAKIPDLENLLLWKPVASFSVCQKTGTATYLDIWDCDHFDGLSDIKTNLAECRVWFSDKGYAFWDAPQTKTGRINCYFRALVKGHYICSVQLQSYAGSAMVECLIDNFNYGPLPFTGTIVQPHPANLNAGYHSFRIRQMSGSYFFVNLTVWKI